MTTQNWDQVLALALALTLTLALDLALALTLALGFVYRRVLELAARRCFGSKTKAGWIGRRSGWWRVQGVWCG